MSENYAVFLTFLFLFPKKRVSRLFYGNSFGTRPTFVVEAPAFFVVETKKMDIDDNAIAQCGAELYAAQIFNAAKDKPQQAVYGCVTSAYSWGFLKLEQNILTIDPDYVSMNFSNPYQVLAALQWVFERSLGAAE
jgi:hypothetical protein